MSNNLNAILFRLNKNNNKMILQQQMEVKIVLKKIIEYQLIINYKYLFDMI